MNENYRATFNTYSGVDMVASITVPGKGPIVFGELTSLSYSVYRQKFPVQSIGRVSVKGYTRGIRSIAGIMSFTQFDETIVYKCMEDIRKQGYRILMDEMPLFDITISMANEFGQQSKMSLFGVTTMTEGTTMGIGEIVTQNVYEFNAIDIDPLTRLNPNGRIGSQIIIQNRNIQVR